MISEKRSMRSSAAGGKTKAREFMLDAISSYTNH